MINKIGLQNVRVFENLQEFDITPITIFTGTNNSGKSTLQKVLMILTNGFVINNDGLIELDDLNFQKELNDITGDFNTNVNYYTNDKSLIFSFSFKDTIWGDVTTILKYKSENNAYSGLLYEISFDNSEGNILTFETFNAQEEELFKIENDEKQLKKIENNGITTNGRCYAWRIKSETKMATVNRIWNKLYDLKQKGITKEKYDCLVIRLMIMNN